MAVPKCRLSAKRAGKQREHVVLGRSQASPGLPKVAMLGIPAGWLGFFQCVPHSSVLAGPDIKYLGMGIINLETVAEKGGRWLGIINQQQVRTGK